MDLIEMGGHDDQAIYNIAVMEGVNEQLAAAKRKVRHSEAVLFLCSCLPACLSVCLHSCPYLAGGLVALLSVLVLYTLVFLICQGQVWDEIINSYDTGKGGR